MKRAFRDLFATSWLGPLVALCIAYGAFAALRPDSFASAANLVTMARQTVVVGLAGAYAILRISFGM